MGSCPCTRMCVPRSFGPSQKLLDFGAVPLVHVVVARVARIWQTELTLDFAGLGEAVVVVLDRDLQGLRLMLPSFD